jgi:hypothetical protein
MQPRHESTALANGDLAETRRSDIVSRLGEEQNLCCQDSGGLPVSIFKQKSAKGPLGTVIIRTFHVHTSTC